MNKSNLEIGMVVETRCGMYCLLSNNNGREFIELKTGLLTSYENEYDNNLLTKYRPNEALDIMKVYKDYTLEELLWERNKNLKLGDNTIEKLEAMKVLGFNWVAKDGDGKLWFYKDKPRKYYPCSFWASDIAGIMYLDIRLRTVKWSDLEPTLIDDLLKNYRKDKINNEQK